MHCGTSQVKEITAWRKKVSIHSLPCVLWKAKEANIVTPIFSNAQGALLPTLTPTWIVPPKHNTLSATGSLVE